MKKQFLQRNILKAPSQSSTHSQSSWLVNGAIDGLSPLLNRVSQPIQPGNGRNLQRISIPQLLENHSLESFSENWQAFEHRRSCEQRH